MRFDNKMELSFVVLIKKKAADDVGLTGQLDETQLILFGNPLVGTQLMVENGFVSIELPLRASAWKRNNTIYVSITNPNALLIPYNLTSKQQVLQKMTDNIEQMIKKVSSDVLL